MPESEVLLVSIPRSDALAGPSTTGPEEHDGPRATTVETPAAPRRHNPPSSSASSTIEEHTSPEAAPQRPSIWQLPFCAATTSWLDVTNAIIYVLTLCINVLVNSGSVWPNVRQVDTQYGPILTPAGWSYYIRDLTLFLWGLAVACQSLAEHRGWKDVLVARIGHSWQVLWYSESIGLLLHVASGPTGLSLAPFFSLAALLAAAAAQAKVAVELTDLQAVLLARDFEGVPPLAYLLYVFPTSLASGWLLVHHCHTTALATQLVTGSVQAALNVGCVMLVVSTAVALLMLLRLRDVVFGLAFTWSCVAVWVAGFASEEEYRADQLVAFFCALLMGMLTYCVAAGPQLRMMVGWSTATLAAEPPPPPPAAAGGAGGSTAAASGGGGLHLW